REGAEERQRSRGAGRQTRLADRRAQAQHVDAAKMREPPLVRDLVRDVRARIHRGAVVAAERAVLVDTSRDGAVKLLTPGELLLSEGAVRGVFRGRGGREPLRRRGGRRGAHAQAVAFAEELID